MPKDYEVAQRLDALVARRVVVAKPSATTITADTTLDADPDLTGALAANTSYWMELIAPFTSPIAAGFKFNFTVPAGTVFTGYAMAYLPSGLSLYTYTSVNLAITTTINLANTSGGGVDDLVAVRGMLATAGTAGTLAYRWAQNTSNAGNTIVRAGSSMLLQVSG